MSLYHAECLLSRHVSDVCWCYHNVCANSSSAHYISILIPNWSIKRENPFYNLQGKDMRQHRQWRHHFISPKIPCRATSIQKATLPNISHTSGGWLCRAESVFCPIKCDELWVSRPRQSSQIVFTTNLRKLISLARTRPVIVKLLHHRAIATVTLFTKALHHHQTPVAII